MISSNGGQAASVPARKLGGRGKTLRVYTFSGGGFDSAMQLGVVHALLLTPEEEWPAVVSGVSAGAISAVSLAEILQSGSELPASEQRGAQVAKFRAVLEAYREGPLQLLKAQFPDGYETNARHVTENLKLPIHVVAERESRDQAQRAESGLIKLLNELLGIDLPMRQAVLLVRLVLAIREGRESHEKVSFVLHEALLLYWRVLQNLDHLSLLVGRILILLLKTKNEQPRACPAREVLFRRKRLGHQISDAWRRLVGALFLVALPIVYGMIRLGAVLRARLSKARKDKWRNTLQQWIPDSWWNHFFSGYAKEECLKTILAHYALAKDIGDSNALRQMFVEVFDPTYFGTLDMVKVTEAALERRKEESEPQKRKPKKLESYAQKKPGIFVSVLASDIARSVVRPVPAETTVVDALLAATAIVPLFRAVGLPVFKDTDRPAPKDAVFYIDGENVNADPLRPTIKFLQETIDLETKAVRFYSAVAFPISKGELAEPKQYRGLVDVAMRSLQLQRFQNSLLERNFINLYHDTLQSVLPSNRAVWDRPGPNGNRRGKYKPLIAARVVSIEVDKPLRLNKKIPAARSHVERRRLIDQAVADGCRATLRAWLADPAEPLHETGLQLREKAGCEIVSCRKLLTAHRERLGNSMPARPESDPAKGPGLCEICNSCSFFRELQKANHDIPAGFVLPEARPPATAASEATYPCAEERPARSLAEPAGRNAGGTPDHSEPTVSLLFSGGVFRGVYQIGVANALQVLGLRPNIVAGASVGSITAALVAEIFSRHDKDDRERQICHLASTYLALDRLILTDRFYDFVRRITLRAGGAQFSPRDLDMLFRRYEEGSTATFSGQARRTIAGLERLFYLSPFELLQLVQQHRKQNYTGLYRLLGKHLQELLDRNGASLEILGAEPLMLLLTEHLLRHHSEKSPRFNLFAHDKGDRKIHLLATVTNLTQGKLRTLGSLYEDQKEWPILREGLLASSAFPGVFRPRNSWELFPTSPDQDQYVDGGVMDNLPLDSIVRFLEHSSKQIDGNGDGLHILRRPAAPHLLVTASLEPNCYPLGRFRTDQIRRSWVSLMTRASQIKYNRKIHDFEVAQRHMREIWDSPQRKAAAFEPLDIEVVTIRPEWLCGTFAFHPMLGFSRRRQAASIAHGCAGTLKQMATLWQRAPVVDGKKYFWGMETAVVEKVRREDGPAKHEAKDLAEGTCWFCSGLICPFSDAALSKQKWETLDNKLPATTRQALTSIYRECGKSETHPKGPELRKTTSEGVAETPRERQTKRPRRTQASSKVPEEAHSKSQTERLWNL